MLIRISLCETDRSQLDAPDELVLDLEALKDLEYDEFDAIEKELALPLAVFTPPLESGSMEQAVVKRVAVYLALRQGGKGVAWADCKPRPGRTDCQREVHAGPPAGPSGASSEDAAAVTS